MTAPLLSTSLLDPDVIENPYPFYRRLHAEAPVWRVPHTEVFVVSTFAMVAEATSRIDDFSSNMKCLLYRDGDGHPLTLSFGDYGVQTLATADPPMHTLHRSTVFPELVAKRMELLETEIAEVAHSCVRAIVESDHADFMEVVGNVLPMTIVSRLIGFHDSDPQRLLRAAFDSTELLSSTLSLERLTELIGAVGEIDAWISSQLATAALDPQADILGSIASGVADGVMSMHEGTIILHTLLSAGGESTTSLIGNAVRMLAEDESLQQQLRTEPHLVPAFVEEALRLHSPFRYLMRSAPRQTALGGVEIPAGSTLLLFWGAANRDAATYERPDDVDLERRPLSRHLAFGRGIHHCVGAPLARLETKILLEVLLAGTSTFTLDPDRPPQWVDSLLVRRHQNLPLRIIGST